MEKPIDQQPVEQSVKPEKKFIRIQSDLKTIDGSKKEFSISLAEDGRPKAVAFFDIDGTLADLKFIHGRAIQKVFPGQKPEELAQTFFAGFGLGNEYREFDRMGGIYLDGHNEWKDQEIYRRERYKKFQKEIDEPGNKIHNRAALYSKLYSQEAPEITKKIYESDPQKFEQAKIMPIFHLAKLYKKLGIPMAVMTANSDVFARAAIKYLGLGELFLDVATTETMKGGGKEMAIQFLMDRLEKKGLKMPGERLIVVGDSIRGDIGVLNKIPEARGKGVLVLEKGEDLAELIGQIEDDEELKKSLANIPIDALAIDKIKLDKRGNPRLGKRFRSEFLTKIKTNG